MSEDKNKGGLTLGLGWILVLIFMILKLTNCIDWSWWWITSPLWIPLVLVGLLGIILLIAKKD